MFALRSFSSLRVLPGVLTGALLSGLCLTGCSSHQQPGTDPDTTPGVSQLEPGGRTTGTQVDSLNGIPGHHFGEPLSAFPGLTTPDSSAYEGNPPYSYPTEKSMGGWWGKQNVKEPGSLTGFYYFPNGKFACFDVTSAGNAIKTLQSEAQFLFGPGIKTANLIKWEGKLAEAYYTRDTPINNHPFSLVVRSHDYYQQVTLARTLAGEAQQKRLNAKLKAENTQ